MSTNSNSKTVWNMVRKITSKFQTAPIKHLSKNNKTITTKKDIADALTETFLKNFSSKNGL